MFTTILLALLLIVIVIALLLFLRMRRLNSERITILQENSGLKDRFQSVLDADAEKQRVLAETEAERARILADITRVRSTNEEAVLNLQGQQLQGQAEPRISAPASQSSEFPQRILPGEYRGDRGYCAPASWRDRNC